MSIPTTPTRHIRRERAMVNAVTSTACQSPWSCRGKPHDETGAGDAAVGGSPVFDTNGAAVGLDDLLVDREAKSRMRAELLAGGALAVEAVEDGGELPLGDAGPGIVDRDDDRVAAALQGERDRGPGRAERNGIGDEI